MAPLVNSTKHLQPDLPGKSLEFHQTFKEELRPILLTHPKSRRGRILPNTFHQASIVLIPNKENDVTSHIEGWGIQVRNKRSSFNLICSPGCGPDQLLLWWPGPTGHPSAVCYGGQAPGATQVLFVNGECAVKT